MNIFSKNTILYKDKVFKSVKGMVFMNNQVSLERIKDTYGKEKLLNQFEFYLRRNRMFALNLINDIGVSFSTFFIVIPVIKKYGIFQKLNMRSKIAMSLCNEILDNTTGSFKIEEKYLMITLEWMVNSAAYDDGIEDDFDTVIDVCYAKLLNEFKDTRMLKPAVDLAFSRNRKQQFNHDLIWAIFKSNDIKTLEYIAEYLKSPYNQDVAFSENLLENITEGEITIDPDNKHESYLNWIKDNSPYINFTDECYNLSSKPTFFNVDMEAKYVCKPAMSMNVGFKLPASKIEENNLETFRNLDEETKRRLSSASEKIYSSSPQQWENWKKTDIKGQLDLISKYGGLL